MKWMKKMKWIKKKKKMIRFAKISLSRDFISVTLCVIFDEKDSYDDYFRITVT